MSDSARNIHQGDWIGDGYFVSLITHKEEIDQYVKEKLTEEQREELYDHVRFNITESILACGFWDILEALVEDKIGEIKNEED